MLGIQPGQKNFKHRCLEYPLTYCKHHLKLTGLLEMKGLSLNSPIVIPPISNFAYKGRPLRPDHGSTRTAASTAIAWYLANSLDENKVLQTASGRLMVAGTAERILNTWPKRNYVLEFSPCRGFLTYYKGVLTSHRHTTQSQTYNVTTVLASAIGFFFDVWALRAGLPTTGIGRGFLEHGER